MHPTDARPPGSADSHRDRSTPQEIASPTRPNSSNWSVLKKVDSTSETDCCSSPDSAVVTGSESLGSSDSVDSLDIIKAESPSTKRNVPSKHRSNRRYRRWCQMRPDLSNSSSSPGSSALTDNKSLDDSTKNAKQHSPIPTAVVRNTLECPVVFPSWSCLPGNASPPCAPYFPTLPHWVHLNWVPHLMPSNGVPLQNPLGSVMVDLTGRDVAYSVERLPPVPQSILKNPYEKISVSPSYPEADQFRGAFAQPFSPPPASSSESGAESTQSRSEINNIVSTPTWHIPPFPSVYIPPPLRIPRALDHCKSLKTCAVPFSEFSHYFNSSPPRRQWRQLGSPSKNGYRLTLMCYNVLSSNYATYSQYPYCPTWAIDWEYRRRGILEELRLYAPNIICLQEIDTDQFETVFVPELAKNNYEGIFLAKSRSRTMEPASARKVDGCAIFWLSEKFTKVTEFRYEFMLSCSNVSEHPSPLLLNRVMTRDNVAIGVVLEIKAPSPGNSRRFCVSTGHIHWDPEHSDVKLIQTIIWTAELWSHLDKLCGDSGKPGSGASRMPVVLCGDLNSLPTSGVVEFLSKGCVPTSHVEFLNFGFSYQFEDWKMLEKWAVDGDILRHRFNFDRAYKGGIADGMKITNLTYDFKGMIDYIFFTRHHFRLLRSLDQIPESWFMEERILGCPHIHVPSDHFSLLVELDLLTQPARGLAISDPSDATGLDNTTTVSAPAPSVTNSPKPKGSAVQRPKQGRR
uniref:Endo/exonuclease/phosphatase domain-containing protein n=2 Tax=Mesocestoides corti TaxID=53468 RepID=A0A5K3EN64_MESCO